MLQVKAIVAKNCMLEVGADQHKILCYLRTYEILCMIYSFWAWINISLTSNGCELSRGARDVDGIHSAHTHTLVLVFTDILVLMSSHKPMSYDRSHSCHQRKTQIPIDWWRSQITQVSADADEPTWHATSRPLRSTEWWMLCIIDRWQTFVDCWQHFTTVDMLSLNFS